MNIINDFFFTVWDKEYDKGAYKASKNEFCASLYETNRDSFCGYMAIIISMSSTNMSDYLALDTTREAIEYFSDTLSWNDNNWQDISSIQKLQFDLLSFLLHRGDMILNKEIGQGIEKLRKASIIEYDYARKLISIMTLIKEKKKDIKKPPAIDSDTESYYDEQVIAVSNLVDMLLDAVEEQTLKVRLLEIPKKIKNQRFSIGVTGVMNAGKSTMLNALLGKEVLGTAVVPETANLTVIKYSEDPKAVVHFWNQADWVAIEDGASVLESMNEFVIETKNHFGSSFDDYIVLGGKSQEIDVDDLPQFTSAEYSDKKCNLVKQVELYTDLEFVQNGVDIVDTPGLDDPVVQREEITKSYLLDCDLLCHLMNVNQSATQKDIDFIVESLLYRNVAQLLVVITRIDTVTEEELREVLEYTMSSIRAKLESLGRGTQFAELISRIEFIPIAGKMALLHRIRREVEALHAGYDLQKSGIIKVEEYFRSVLFGKESTKAGLIISASKKELSSIIETQTASYEQQRELLGKSTEEIEAVYLRHKIESEELKKSVERLNKEIETGRRELEEYLLILEKFIGNKLTDLGSLVKRRIMDDVSYELRKNKKKPTPQRISSILETGIRDGFTDMIREYRYLFQKRVEETMERIGRSFQEFSISQTDENDSAKELLGRHFDRLLLSGSHTILEKKINLSVAKASKKELSGLDSQLRRYLDEEMNLIKEKFDTKVADLNSELLDGFESKCHEPILKITQAMESRDRMLQEMIDSAKNDTKNKVHRAKEIDEYLAIFSKAREILHAEVSR